MPNRLLLAALLVGGAPLLAAPGHYFVFEMDANGKPTPVFYKAVAYSDLPQADAIAKQRAQTDPDQLLVRSDDQVSVEDVPRFVRGEFGKNADGLGEIESVSVPIQPRSFAVRLWDRGPAQRFHLNYQGQDYEFSVSDLIAQHQHFALADYAPTVQLNRAISAGPPANRVDILVLGDGYTAAQQSLFNTNATTLQTSMFNLSPYREYQNFVNWTTAFVASTQSGADHPPYLAGCSTSTCCNDTAAQTDPHAGQFVNTAFDATFCTSQIHRLLTVNGTKVNAAAASFPDRDKIIIVINDDVYGGAGGTFATTSTNPSADQIVLHEYGHSFTRLADEYDSPFPGFPACSDVSGSGLSLCEANVTNVTDPALVKWRLWFTPGNPIPTPAGTAGVGLFQGARYLTSGMYRPVNACLMRFLGVPFCDVCKEAYVKTIYRGGFGGVPAAGIALIDPGTASPSNAATVNLTAGMAQTFSASVLSTVPTNTIQSTWRINGVTVGTGTSFTYTPITAGTYTLELQALDTTALVKPANVVGPLETRLSWTLSVSGNTDNIFGSGFE
jgi:IgA Peptidase M64